MLKHFSFFLLSVLAFGQAQEPTINEPLPRAARVPPDKYGVRLFDLTLTHERQDRALPVGNFVLTELPRWQDSAKSWNGSGLADCLNLGPFVLRRDPQWINPMDPNAQLKYLAIRPKLGLRLPFLKKLSPDVGGSLSTRKVGLRIGARW